MRLSMTVVAVAGLAAGVLGTAPVVVAAPADVNECSSPECTPGIAAHIVLGSNCSNSTYYAFGVTDWGRLVFCGSPRRYEPRWFRSPEMHGIRDENSNCRGYDGEVAQAPDGLFLTCVAEKGEALWRRGDL